MSAALEMQEWETKKLAGVFLADECERSQAALLKNGGILDITELIDGLEIKTNSHVGQISFKNIHLSIKPKLTGLPLARLFCYTYGFENLKLIGNNNYELAHLSFFDLLIYALQLYVDGMIRSGIAKGYTRREDDLPYVRGRIDTKRLVSTGGILGVTVPCHYFLRDENMFLNQTILSGLKLAHSVAANYDLKYELQKTIKILSDSVDNTILSSLSLSVARQSINRLTEDYRPIIDIIEIVFNAWSQKLNSNGSEAVLPGFFFDMNTFFEKLILKLLNTLPAEYKIIDQYRLKQLFSYDPKYNPKRCAKPTPRPDFALAKNGQVLQFFDAKYRDLWEKDLPSNMLYQLSVYALSGVGNRKSTILYPAMSDTPQKQTINIFNPANGLDMAQVEICAINLSRISALLPSGSNFAIEQYIKSIVLSGIA